MFPRYLYIMFATCVCTKKCLKWALVCVFQTSLSCKIKQDKNRVRWNTLPSLSLSWGTWTEHSWSAESAKGSQVASKANADLHVVDRPTQLICISDIYLLSADKYQRQSKANADLHEERNEFKTLMSQFFLSLQLCEVEKYQQRALLSLITYNTVLLRYSCWIK